MTNLLSHLVLLSEFVAAVAFAFVKRHEVITHIKPDIIRVCRDIKLGRVTTFGIRARHF